MHGFPRTALTLLTLSALGACGGGGDDGGGGGGTVASSDVAVRFSDAPVDALESVVITVDSMTFRREGDDDTVVETFTSDELELVDADSFTIDLLDVQGDESRLVLDSVELPVGRYSDLRLDIVDEDVNFSYVEELESSELKELKVPSGELKLGPFEVSPLSTQTFVIEFELRKSMTYNPGPDRYILKPRGVRIVALQEASAIEGSVDVAALNAATPCDAKPDVTLGNAVYLYPGHDLGAAALADNFDPALAGADADGRAAPTASAALDADGAFVFAYLEPGDYTLAASCEAEADDDADALDASITVPSPADWVVETTLVRGERERCTFAATERVCVTLEEASEEAPEGAGEEAEEGTEEG